MKSKHIFLIQKTITIISVTIIYYAVCAFMNITCPIYAFFDFPCPTCGVTRAILSLLKLDFSGYLEYNAMALPMIISFLIAFFVDTKKHSAALGAVFIILGLNTVYYFSRLCDIWS